ncbi:unnamed protein product [Cylicocyclus nassatus]|uniref:C2H2-type domain-containing protein n=1 Tax=Cylicocyclus nassatus TaxID=53992 RepID=A0AA36H7H4_CYLNA|nr:unnamed protein product [Cylicocyclus nassatus]
MTEHRKKERRKEGSVVECNSPNATLLENASDLASKYDSMQPSCASDDVDGLVCEERSSSPVVNNFVIDSDDDCDRNANEINGDDGNSHANFSSSCGAEVITHNLDTNRAYRQRHALPPKGSKERAEILKENAKRRIQESAKRHQCPYCEYCAPFPSKVKRHIASWHSDSHCCPDCHAKFSTYSMLRKHISIEHPKTHKCQFCDYSHKIRAYVRKHTIANHEKGMLCTIAGCNKRVSRWRLRAHLEQEHPLFELKNSSSDSSSPAIEADLALKCSQCSFETDELEDYNSHVQNAHGSGIECPIPGCSIRFLLGDMDRHFSSMHDHSELEHDLRKSLLESRYEASCTTTTISDCVSTSSCSETPSSIVDFATPKHSLRGIPENNQGRTDFQCSICRREYGNYRLLRKHIKSVHEKSYATYTRLPKYACNIDDCKKVFTTSGLLQDHINMHKDVKPYTCTHCDRSFHARARFAVHLSKYHGASIRDYCCVSNFLTQSVHGKRE